MAWWITTSVSTIILTHRSAMRCSQESLQRALDEVCGRLELEYQLEWGTRPKRLCIFVSKYDHVLWEILLRHKAGELPCDIPLIISNHADLQPIADAFGVLRKRPAHIHHVLHISPPSESVDARVCAA